MGVNLSLAKRVKWLASPIIILIIISFILSLGICTAVIQVDNEEATSVDACSLDCEKYTISLGDTNYNDSSDSTDINYVVSVGNGTCGMQSWFLVAGGCLSANDIISASPAPWEFIEIEGRPGVRAIMFDAGIESPGAGKPERSRIYSLKLAGNWSRKTAPVEAVIVAIDGKCSKNLLGPSC